MGPAIFGILGLRALRRVIRNIKTQEFFQAGTWTADASSAQDFPDTRELLATCARYQLKDVELIVQTDFEPPGFEICLPLPTLGPETISAARQSAH